MTGSDPTRRRVLAGLGGAIALGVGGWAAALGSRSDTQPPPRASELPPATSAVDLSTVAPTDDPTTTTVRATTSSTPPPMEIDVICRSAWGAREPRSGLVPHNVAQLTLHHTAVVLVDNSDAPGRARAHQRFHLDSGFADLAYHFMVDLAGNVLEGRSTDYAGETFTEYDPAGHFLVCCEGNYDEQTPTAAQLDAVAMLFAWGAETFDADVGTLSGHRDHASTSCPGDNLYAGLADGTLTAAVERALAAGVVRHDLCGDAGREAVAAIEAA